MMAALAHRVPGEWLGHSVLANTFRHPVAPGEGRDGDGPRHRRPVHRRASGWAGTRASTRRSGSRCRRFAERFDRLARAFGCVRAALLAGGGVGAGRHPRRPVLPLRGATNEPPPLHPGRPADLARRPGPKGHAAWRSEQGDGWSCPAMPVTDPAILRRAAGHDPRRDGEGRPRSRGRSVRGPGGRRRRRGRPSRGTRPRDRVRPLRRQARQRRGPGAPRACRARRRRARGRRARPRPRSGRRGSCAVTDEPAHDAATPPPPAADGDEPAESAPSAEPAPPVEPPAEAHPWAEPDRPRGLDAYFAPGGEDDAPPGASRGRAATDPASRPDGRPARRRAAAPDVRRVRGQQLASGGCDRPPLTATAQRTPRPCEDEDRAEHDEGSRREDLDRPLGQPRAQEGADADRDRVGRDHPGRRAQPDPDRLVVRGERDRGEHRLVAQLREEEGRPDGDASPSASIGRPATRPSRRGDRPAASRRRRRRTPGRRRC